MAPPPSSPGSHASSTAGTCAAIQGSAKTRPSISTTTVGVPVATTASTSCCCTPVRPRSAASRNSPLVHSRRRPERPPTHTMATSASRAAATASAMPLASSPLMAQPATWRTSVRGPTAARMPASGVTIGTKYGPGLNATSSERGRMSSAPRRPDVP